MLLEVACFNLESCLIAQKAGAHRIELCENYPAGGITPSEIIISEARKNLQIELYVMIRPRAGDFFYSKEEFDLMRSQIKFCKENKCDGLVFGILTKENKVDLERCKEFVDLAKPLPCTFHRAFDQIKDSEQALEDIIACGFKRILTSGKQETAVKGHAIISSLINRSKKRITIISGGGIRSSNISELIQKTNASEIHSSAITNASEVADEKEIKVLLSLL